MKEIIIKSIKKQIPIMIVIIAVIAVQQYVLTLPSKYIGVIVDELIRLKSEVNIQVSEELKNGLSKLVLSSIYVMIGIVIWRFLVAVSTRNFQKDVMDKVFARFNKLNYKSMQSMKNGEMMAYLSVDSKQMARLLFVIESHFNRGLMSFIINFFLMKSISPKLTICTLIPIILTAIITYFLKNTIGKTSEIAKRDFTQLSEFVQESTDAIRTTKAYSMEKSQMEKFEEKNTKLKKSNIKVDFYVALLGISIEVCFGICYAILIGYGGFLVANGVISVGEVVAFAGYIELLYKPLQWFPKIISTYKTTKISYNRVEKICSAPIEEISFESDKEKMKPINTIEIKNLDFEYGNGKKVLNNISLNIKKGERLGIIGTIGSGKSTLVNLLVRLYDVPVNTIFVNGKDINTYDLVNLRERICYITQDSFLFSTAISKNISLFKEDFSDQAIIKSLELSAFSEDLANMENGIETIIGEKGIDLSGGQKQRVALARGIIKTSDVVIFDDCFSALDNKTEEIVFNNINKLFKDKICIIISNRISEVKDADAIIVLDNGNIIERGTHQELVNNNKLYNKFYYQQLSQDRDDD